MGQEPNSEGVIVMFRPGDGIQTTGSQWIFNNLFVPMLSLSSSLIPRF